MIRALRLVPAAPAAERASARSAAPPAPPGDAELVARVRGGDGDAFESLVRRHYRAAFSVALALTGEQADAEDVCQDAFVRALERIAQCREPDRFLGWLLQIVRSQAFNLLGRQKVRAAEPLAEDVAAAPDNPSGDAHRSELRERLQAALARLSPAQRQVVLLHDMEGWTHREVAAAVGCSELMSRQHLFNARRALRRLLGEYRNGEGPGE